MKRAFLAICLLSSALFSACGGGGAAGGGAGVYNPMPGGPPPTPGPTVQPGTVLATHSIDGGPAFVTTSHKPVYEFDGDTTANQSNCTGGCASIWPPVAPPAGNLQAPWRAFQRTDGSMQLSFKGRPLYTFVNDTQPFVSNGNGVEGFHLARP